MALPTSLHEVICTEYDPLSGLPLPAPTFHVPLEDLGIHFPGGTFLQGVGAKMSDSPKLLLAQLNAALMPLMPLFNIIDALLAVGKVMEAVKTLNPVKIASELKKLLPKLDKLKSLVPQIAVPVMILDTIDALIAFLIIFRTDLAAIVTASVKLELAAARAADLGDPEALLIAIACGRSQLDTVFAGLKSTAAPVNRLVGILNLVGGIIGLPELPSLSDLGPHAGDALVPIDTLISALTTVRGLIPV